MWGECGWMFWKSCTSDAQCCPQHDWHCASDSKCVWKSMSIHLSCSQYEMLSKKILQGVQKVGCKAGAKVACITATGFTGVALCEAIGLGPEDPLADICAVAAVAGVSYACSEGCTLLTN